MAASVETCPIPYDAEGDAAGSGVTAVLAQLARNAVAGGLASGCIIKWATAGDAGVAYAPSDFPLTSILALADRQFRRAAHTARQIHLSPAMLRPLLQDRFNDDERACGLACVSEANDGKTLVVLLTTRAVNDELWAHAHLIENCAHHAIIAHAANESRDFWRSTATANAERLAQLQTQQAAEDAKQALIDDAASACAKLQPNDRLAGLGRVIAKVGNCDWWMVASATNDGLQIVAASTREEKTLPIEFRKTMTEALHAATVALRNHAALPASNGPERASCLCIPFTDIVVALGYRDLIPAATIAPMDRLRKRLLSTVENWRTSDEIQRLQNLVRTLGLRMYRAVDEERRRIARDFHDDLAQVLTAARITLETDATAARDILKQLDVALRTRVRELRPATLGQSNLRDAIGDEIDRLADGGIKARLLHPLVTTRLSRPLQVLCYHIVREAFSNILRHAGATKVEVEIIKSGDGVLLRIDDDGSGPRRSRASRRTAGVGLTGLAERVELMGGKLRIERLDSITRLSAEIPEL